MDMLRHLHWLFIALYLLSFLTKSYLFLAGNGNTYEKFRKRTLIIENVLAVAFLATGIAMLVQNPGYLSGGWMHVKLTLVVVAIPLGIVGFRKNSKALVFLAATCFVAVLAMALYFGTSQIL